VTPSSLPRKSVRALWLTLFTLLALGLFGCGKDEPVKPASAPPSVVRFGYFANLTHAQAVLGVATGDYAKAIAPAKLETKLFNAGPSVIEALFAGELDVAYIGPGPAISGFSKSRGQGLVVVSGAAANGVAIVAREGSGITKLEDLAGKRVATPQLGNTQDVAARHFLKTVLGQKNLDNVVPVTNAEQAALMSRGEIDAAWAPEPWAERLMTETGAKLVGEEKDLWPNKEFALTYVIASPEFAKKHRPTLEALLASHRTFTAKLSADPAGQLPTLAEALFQLTGKKLPEGVLPRALARVKFTDAADQATLETYATWTFDLGFEREKPDVSKMVDRSFGAK
jgi:NitT/TauT family transport system substrate-binding protein